MRGADSPWLPDARPKVDAVVHNQSWRDHLLAVTLLNHPRSLYNHGALMLVRYDGDTKGAQVVRGYSKLLRPGDQSFLDMTLSNLMSTWREVEGDESHFAWLEAFQRRYAAVEESARAF